MKHIIFICTGNLCRSPMAEGIMKKLWHEQYSEELWVSSMGIHAAKGKKVSKTAVNICKEYGIDISSHVSRPLISSELKNADMIFSMEKIHKEYLRVFYPEIDDKSFLLRMWPDNKKKFFTEIPDPVGGNYGLYRKVFKIIYKDIKRIIPYIYDNYISK